MTDLWTHVGFARLATLLGDEAGLRFTPNRQPAAEMAFRRVMREAGEPDPLAFARALEERPELLSAVLAEVTVGETYFFREPGQLDFIRRELIPAFRATRSPTRPLRVWSAGCATGEEAYTLAILLREGGLESASRVVGTDLSGPRLAAAEQARYTRWSMRGVADEVVERYFIRRGRQFLLRPEIRAMVEFHPLNLAGGHYPGGRSGIDEMDLILCRNVLIYFDRATVATVADRLLASLSEDGWLFLGASDPMLAGLVPCETIVTGAGLAYRRAGAEVGDSWRGWRDTAPGALRGMVVEETEAAGDPFVAPGRELVEGGAPRADFARGAPPTENLAPRPPVAVTLPTPGVSEQPTAPPYRQRYDAQDYDAAADLATDAVGRDPRDADAWAVLVRALANAGRIDEAERACTAALERRPDSAPLAYLNAVLLARRGQHAAAAAAARRALYLDRGLAVAHMTLGSALARLGESDQARRAFRAAERLLERLPADEPVPLADGENARRLAEAARANRRRIGTPAA